METRVTALPKLFIGIDIHKRSWKIHCSTDLFAGKSFTMPPEPHKLLEYVQKHFPDHEVSTAYEAGCCGYYAHRSFESFGWKSLVVNPADIHRKGKERYTKTDRIDAQLISRELKDGRLDGITVPDKQREELRSLFRRRNDLVKDLRRVKSVIKMQLLYFGVTVPPEFDNDHWSHEFRNWVDSQEFVYGTAKECLASKMRSFRFIDKELRNVTSQLRAYCRKHFKNDYYLLRSVPGIGGIVAVGILSELGDLRRFNSLKHLAGYVGLAPGIHQSGATSKSMGMNPRCHRLIRSYFVEAAWQAIRTDPVMQAYYRQHLGKDVKKIIVKVAHKLLSRTLAVIKTQIPYENPDNDLNGPWKSDPATAQAGHATKSQFYTLTAPNGKKHNPPSGRCWLFTEEVMMRHIENNKIWFGAHGNNVPRVKTYLHEKERGLTPETVLFAAEASTNERAKNELKDYFGGNAVFVTPKPVNLVELLLKIGSAKNSVILDSFAGSGTTAHAVLNLNKKDGGNRKFILIEMEDYAKEITAERVKRVIKGYGKETKKTEGTGGDFNFYKLGQPLFNEGEVLNEHVGKEEILKYVWFSETKLPFQQQEEAYFLGLKEDTAYYFLYEKEEMTTLNESFLRGIKTKAEQYIIYADNCLLDEKFMDKYHIIFKKIPRDITRF